MTTATKIACAGGCNRPAVWEITTASGDVYKRDARDYTPVHYCKAHADAEVARLLAEIPSAVRRHRYDVESNRHDAAYPISEAAGKLRDIAWKMERLGAGNGNRGQTPDPWFAALVLAELEKDFGPDLSARLGACYDRIMKQSHDNIPA